MGETTSREYPVEPAGGPHTAGAETATGSRASRCPPPSWAALRSSHPGLRREGGHSACPSLIPSSVGWAWSPRWGRACCGVSAPSNADTWWGNGLGSRLPLGPRQRSSGLTGSDNGEQQRAWAPEPQSLRPTCVLVCSGPFIPAPLPQCSDRPWKGQWSVGAAPLGCWRQGAARRPCWGWGPTLGVRGRRGQPPLRGKRGLVILAGPPYLKSDLTLPVPICYFFCSPRLCHTVYFTCFPRLLPGRLPLFCPPLYLQCLE